VPTATLLGREPPGGRGPTLPTRQQPAVRTAQVTGPPTGSVSAAVGSLRAVRPVG